MRSSWEASATNWRRRSSEADFSSKATSIWVSIWFRAEPRRPISVPGRPSGTRRVRSPEAMASAVPAIWRRGRRPRRTTTRTSRPMASRTATLAISSTLRSEASVSLVGVQRNGGDERALRHRDGDRAVAAVGIAGAPQHDGVGVGAEGAGVAPDPHPVVEVGHLLHRDVLGQDRRRVRTGYRTRRAGQDDLAVVVQQLHVDVGGDAPRQVGLVDREAALGGVGQVVEAERLVLGQRVVGLAVEE